jgi:hypothetical protein
MLGGKVRYTSSSFYIFSWYRDACCCLLPVVDNGHLARYPWHFRHFMPSSAALVHARDFQLNARLTLQQAFPVSPSRT